MSDENTGAPSSRHYDSSELLGKLQRVGSKLGARSKELSDTKKLLEAKEAEAAAALAEVEKWKKAADSNPLVKQVADLKAERREMKHKEAFDRIALERGIEARKLADAHTLSGYKPQTDEPDEATIGMTIDNMRATRDYLFAKPEGAGGSSTAP